MIKKIIKNIFYLINGILSYFGYRIEKMEFRFKSINLREDSAGEEIKISFTEDFYPIQRIILSAGSREVGKLDWQETIGRSSIDLHNIRVDKLYRNKGYGAKLLEQLEKIARERKISSIHLFVGDDNDKAVGFYKHHGFREVKELAGYFLNSEHQKNHMMYVKKL